jgi:hypothetical protein
MALGLVIVAWLSEEGVEGVRWRVYHCIGR